MPGALTKVKKMPDSGDASGVRISATAVAIGIITIAISLAGMGGAVIQNQFVSMKAIIDQNRFDHTEFVKEMSFDLKDIRENYLPSKTYEDVKSRSVQEFERLNRIAQAQVVQTGTIHELSARLDSADKSLIKLDSSIINLNNVVATLRDLEYQAKAINSRIDFHNTRLLIVEGNIMKSAREPVEKETITVMTNYLGKQLDALQSQINDVNRQIAAILVSDMKKMPDGK